jgi:site-specific DNA recombinase
VATADRLLGDADAEQPGADDADRHPESAIAGRRSTPSTIGSGRWLWGHGKPRCHIYRDRSIEDDLRGLAEDFGHGRITRGEWLPARTPLEQRLQAAQAAVVEAEATEAVEVVDVDLRKVWPTLHVDRQRAFLAAVFTRVEVSPSTRRGGPAPIVEGVGRIDLDRVSVVWRV